MWFFGSTLKIPWTRQINNKEFFLKKWQQKEFIQNQENAVEITWTNNEEGRLKTLNPDGVY